jgi:hypothetical protein
MAKRHADILSTAIPGIDRICAGSSRAGECGLTKINRQAIDGKSNMAPIPRLRPYRGPAILSYGFRPFFLLGSLYAGLAILAWLPILHGELSVATAFAPRDWHVHEMLFG